MRRKSIKAGVVTACSVRQYRDFRRGSDLRPRMPACSPHTANLRLLRTTRVRRRRLVVNLRPMLGGGNDREWATAWTLPRMFLVSSVPHLERRPPIAVLPFHHHVKSASKIFQKLSRPAQDCGRSIYMSPGVGFNTTTFGDDGVHKAVWAGDVSQPLMARRCA